MARKLVSIRQIRQLDAIPGADRIEVASVDGWKLVVKRGEFAVGDACVYFEIDSFLLESEARFQFLTAKGTKELDGQKGHRLRTVRLRGQISQGLALPLSAFPELRGLPMGEDVTELLPVKKWEPPVPANLRGDFKGLFPTFIRKTDQERCQNLLQEIFVENRDAAYEVTIKLDGTSTTMYYRLGDVGVCSRNLEFALTEANQQNTAIRLFYSLGIHDALVQLGRNLALQGEVIGPGIQKNPEMLKEPAFYLFDIFDIDTHAYVAPAERHQLVAQLNAAGAQLKHVPVMHHQTTLGQLGIENAAQLLAYAEGPSLVSPQREGLVFKRSDGGFSFKAISNAYLEDERD